ncbi:MAG: hypothetical protein ACOYOS_07985 [Syntrophales bacterium]
MKIDLFLSQAMTADPIEWKRIRDIQLDRKSLPLEHRLTASDALNHNALPRLHPHPPMEI